MTSDIIHSRRATPTRWQRSFHERSAIVTGGASGIGAALGAALASSGAHVVLADLDGAAAERTASEIRDRLRAVGMVRGVQLDVTNRAAVTRLVENTADGETGLDLLFNNAGIAVGGPSADMPAEHWDRCIDVNLGGVVNGIIAALPVMSAQGRGHIVNTASAAGLVPAVFAAAYCATKHAVVGLSGALRPEAAAHGVRVTVLCPGMVETPILDQGPPSGLPRPSRPALTGRAYLSALGMRPMTADAFARIALRGVARNRSIVVTPATPRIGWWLHRIAPSAIDLVNRRAATRVRLAMAALPGEEDDS
jgi:NAD(P)-dependent dehydrogenase (short-subunit alcohol dehydrogenase family)